MEFTPDILTNEKGEKVTPSNWEERRKELVAILAREEYGFMPAAPAKVEGEIINEVKKCAAGSCFYQDIELRFDAPKGEMKFPMKFFFIPDGKKHPTVVMLSFSRDTYEGYCPVEEVIDHGYQIAKFCYEDVAPDSAEVGGIELFYPCEGESAWGKIGMWAFAASRVVDYLYSRSEVDTGNIAVAGHSRLGKTALWCAANDERIKYAHSNCSGCSGAAYERIKHEKSETLERITARFPYWFCKKFLSYVGHEGERPFDQHFLVAAIAPRNVMIASATLDFWADQYSEQLSVLAASEVYEMLGKKPFSGKSEPFGSGESALDGDIGYHLRSGTHYFSRRDWLGFIEFMNKKGAGGI